MHAHTGHGRTLTVRDGCFDKNFGDGSENEHHTVTYQYVVALPEELDGFPRANQEENTTQEQKLHEDTEVAAQAK
jgi:hypothetical protein